MRMRFHCKNAAEIIKRVTGTELLTAKWQYDSLYFDYQVLFLRHIRNK